MVRHYTVDGHPRVEYFEVPDNEVPVFLARDKSWKKGLDVMAWLLLLMAYGMPAGLVLGFIELTTPGPALLYIGLSMLTGLVVGVISYIRSLERVVRGQ